MTLIQTHLPLQLPRLLVHHRHRRHHHLHHWDFPLFRLRSVYFPTDTAIHKYKTTHRQHHITYFCITTVRSSSYRDGDSSKIIVSRIRLVPPGLGKPSTHSRNKRRRLKKPTNLRKETLLADAPGPPKGGSLINNLPLGQRKSKSGPSSLPPNHTNNPLLSAKSSIFETDAQDGYLYFSI